MARPISNFSPDDNESNPIIVPLLIVISTLHWNESINILSGLVTVYVISLKPSKIEFNSFQGAVP